MKKITALALIATLTLAACQNADDKKTEKNTPVSSITDSIYGIHGTDTIIRYTLTNPSGMLGQVHRSGFVCGGCIVDLQFIGSGECIDYADRQIAGIAFFAIPAQVAESKAAVACQLFCFPYYFVVSFDTAMEAIAIVVCRKLILFPFQCKGCMGNTVSIAADECTKIGVAFLEVAAETAKTQYHIALIAVFVGRNNIGNGAAIVEDADLHARRIGEGVAYDRIRAMNTIYAVCNR